MRVRDSRSDSLRGPPGWDVVDGGRRLGVALFKSPPRVRLNAARASNGKQLLLAVHCEDQRSQGRQRGFLKFLRGYFEALVDGLFFTTDAGGRRLFLSPVRRRHACVVPSEADYQYLRTMLIRSLQIWLLMVVVLGMFSSPH